MKQQATLGLLAACVAMSAPLTVFADGAPMTAAPKTAADARTDPNTVVCKAQDTTGTRLGAKKVCLTRQQWADMAMDARRQTERNQPLQPPR